MEKNRYGLYWIYQKTKGIRFLLVLYLLLVLCIPVIQLSFAYFMKLFIDIATGIIDMQLLRVGIQTIVLVAIGGIVIMINAVLVKWIYGKIECNLRAEILDSILSRRMVDISKQHTGELLTKLTVDVQAVSMCFKEVIENIVGGVASALLAILALFFLNWKIAIILLVLIPLLMFFMGALTPNIQKASEEDKHKDEINRSLIQENVSRIMLIKTYFMQPKIIKKVRDVYEGKFKSGIRLGIWEGIAAFAGTLFGNVMSLVTLGLGAYFVLKGETTVGSLIMIVQLLNYIVTPVSKFPVSIALITQAVASSGRIGMIYDLPADKIISELRLENAKKLVVENLCFSYDDINEEGKHNDLLHNINMSFKKGEVTGIVGRSGSGKSTLLKLLTGAYSPNSGIVELRNSSGILRGEEIMSQIAYVPPADYLFSGSVTENIIMSDNQPRYDEMQAAASSANIIEFIKSLPNGFDTLLGEGGGTVSSGQAQRIAIARAVYRKALIVIFDEPTANLDVDSIDKFKSLVKQLAKEKICIIVSHDVSTITACDKTYILENGDVRESLSGEYLTMDSE